MCSEFQSRRIALPRQGARKLRAKFHGFELISGSCGPAFFASAAAPTTRCRRFPGPMQSAAAA
jgi:hypothetical protein